MLQLHWHVELGTFDIFKYLLELLANVANAAALAAGAILRVPELVQNADDLNKKVEDKVYSLTYNFIHIDIDSKLSEREAS